MKVQTNNVLVSSTLSQVQAQWFLLSTKIFKNSCKKPTSHNQLQHREKAAVCDALCVFQAHFSVWLEQSIQIKLLVLQWLQKAILSPCSSCNQHWSCTAQHSWSFLCIPATSRACLLCSREHLLFMGTCGDADFTPSLQNWDDIAWWCKERRGYTFLPLSSSFILMDIQPLIQSQVVLAAGSSLSPAMFSNSSWGIPGQVRCLISPACSGSDLPVSSQLDRSGKSPVEDAQVA